MTTLRLLSPLAGVVRPVSAVPDPVFAEGMVGPGIALEPQHVHLMMTWIGTQPSEQMVDGLHGTFHPLREAGAVEHQQAGDADRLVADSGLTRDVVNGTAVDHG